MSQTLGLNKEWDMPNLQLLAGLSDKGPLLTTHKVTENSWGQYSFSKSGPQPGDSDRVAEGVNGTHVPGNDLWTCKAFNQLTST